MYPFENRSEEKGAYKAAVSETRTGIAQLVSGEAVTDLWLDARHSPRRALHDHSLRQTRHLKKASKAHQQ